ncbi:hypothetical protein EMCRGX_G028679 [Ephydatia muelleri]
MLPFLVGIYTGDEDKDDQRLCVVEHKAIRLIHAFTCAGMLPSQFINFCKFAEIGVVSNKYIHSVRQYQQIVADSAEESMNAAVQRVKANPEYVTSGEWVITDARHDSSANANSTLYGWKNVAKEMKKICAGPVKARDKTWFAQLSDKARSTKVHLYWCMKNCASNPDILCNMIMNISQHFQGHHLICHLESRCRQPGYHPKRKILTMREAIKAYEDALKRTLIYRFAGSFCRCRDTFWMESFNHQLLTYLPKRIHFHTDTFKMRMYLAVMDWNENTQRASTSHGEYLDVCRPDHHSTYNVLKRKTFQFVRNIWNAYILKNISSLHSFEEDDAIDELMSPDDSTLLDGEYVDSESEEYQEDDDNDA